MERALPRVLSSTVVTVAVCSRIHGSSLFFAFPLSRLCVTRRCLVLWIDATPQPPIFRWTNTREKGQGRRLAPKRLSGPTYMSQNTETDERVCRGKNGVQG